MADALPELINPGLGHTSPQGKYRGKRSLFSDLKPTRAHLKAFAAATSGHSSVTPAEYDQVVCQFQGWRYSQFCDRCGGTCGSFDCSGLQCHVLNLLGIGIGCCTSFVMATMCYDEGLYIPYDQARSTQSHWAFIGYNQGRSPKPGNEGHVVDGRGIVNGRAETMEAMGRRWGCLIANWDGRGWDGTYKIPGVNYAPLAVPWKVQPMFNPALETRAMLNDPGRGAWVGLSDGTVLHSGPDNSVTRGGMTLEPADAAAFKGRTLATLHPRKRKDGSNGYYIVATSGEKYTPIGQA